MFDIILQARYKSKRLPGKMLLKLDNSTVIEFLIKNLKKIKLVNKICLAVPDDKFSKIFKKIAKKNKIEFYVAKNIKENDVLSRFYFCAKKNKFQNILRITPDCPFINIHLISFMINFFKKNKLSYLTNKNLKKFIPHGFECEIFSFLLLKKAFSKAKTLNDREHVTPWIYRNYSRKKNFIRIFNKDYSKLRITLDYKSDYYFFLKNLIILKRISLSKKPEILIKKLI